MIKRKTTHKEQGRITPNGVALEKHEMDTVVVFTELGYDIELIAPSNTPNNKCPDIKMNGCVWEIKSPTGDSKSTLEHIFKKAAKKCDSVIIDLRRTKIKDADALLIIKKLFNGSRRVKRLKVVLKSREVIDF